jgi:hypothetical protein
MKTFALVGAMLKGFIRNYRSVLLIIVVPLLIVMSIFLAFSQDGMRDISVGYSIEQGSNLDIKTMEESIKLFTNVRNYYNHDSCMHELKNYNEYVCIKIKGTGPYSIDIYYDNTREPIIWEVLERLNQAFIFAQQKYSKEMTESYLNAGKDMLSQINLFSSELSNVNSKLYDAQVEIGKEQNRVDLLRSDLGSNLLEMDKELKETQYSNTQLRSEVNTNLYEAQKTTRDLRFTVTAIPTSEENYDAKIQALNEIDNTIREIDDLTYGFNDRMDAQDSKLANYDNKIKKGWVVYNELDDVKVKLHSLAYQLSQYSRNVTSTQNELKLTADKSVDLNFLDADNIVRPIRTENIPTYVPTFSDDQISRWQESLSQEEQLLKGFSLISLQTIYPSILILITMFLSLLISTYVTLSSINSKTYERLKLVRGITLPHFISLIISSLLIIMIPVAVVILIGGILFRLHIMAQFYAILSGILLLGLIIILLGMIIALLIRKESIALTTSTFVLIIMIFYSGFLLPVERMSDGFSFIAQNSPGTLAGLIFKQAVFYHVVALNEIMIMLFQLIFLLIIGFIIRLYK